MLLFAIMNNFSSLKNKPSRSSKRILFRYNKVFVDITDARYSYLGQFQLLEYTIFVCFCLLLSPTLALYRNYLL